MAENAAKITRTDVVAELAEQLWAVPQTANERYELYDRSLNRELWLSYRGASDAATFTILNLEKTFGPLMPPE